MSRERTTENLTTIDETRRKIKMGRIVATKYIPLDGLVEAPDGGEPTIEG